MHDTAEPNYKPNPQTICMGAPYLKGKMSLNNFMSITLFLKQIKNIKIINTY